MCVWWVGGQKHRGDNLHSARDAPPYPRVCAGNFSPSTHAWPAETGQEAKIRSHRYGHMRISRSWDSLCVLKAHPVFFLVFLHHLAAFPRCGAQQPELIQAGIWSRGSGRLRCFCPACSLTSAAFTEPGDPTGETFIRTEGAGSVSLHPQSCLRRGTAGCRFSGVAQAENREFTTHERYCGVELEDKSLACPLMPVVCCCVGYCHI